MGSAERYTGEFPEPLWYSTLSPLNVFYLDHDPRLAAQAHCDRHVVKMVLETAQILSTVWHLQALDSIGELPVFQTLDREVAANEVPGFVRTLAGQRIYRATHRAHPCVLWAAESRANYDWLWRLGMHLAEEYTHRYKKRHGTESVLWTLEAVPPGLGEEPQSEPPLVMPESCWFVADGVSHAVPSYRRAYAETKYALFSWRDREQPSWLEKTDQGWRAVGLAPD